MCTSDAKDCTTQCRSNVRLYLLGPSASSLLVKADLNILAEFEQEHSNYIKRRINWDKLPLNVIRLYKQYSSDGFSSITLPHGVNCTNPNCSCPSHANDIDELYDNII